MPNRLGHHPVALPDRHGGAHMPRRRCASALSPAEGAAPPWSGSQRPRITSLLNGRPSCSILTGALPTCNNRRKDDGLMQRPLRSAPSPLPRRRTHPPVLLHALGVGDDHVRIGLNGVHNPPQICETV